MAVGGQKEEEEEQGQAAAEAGEGNEVHRRELQLCQQTAMRPTEEERRKGDEQKDDEG